MTNFETRYQCLLQLASDGLIIYNREGTILDFNDGACFSLGYTREEFASMNLFQLLEGEELKKRPLAFDELNKGIKVTDRRKIRTKDKGIYLVEVSTIMLPDGNMMALAKDITEKARIEKDLRIKDHAISTVVAAIGMADLDGSILYVNEAGSGMWGFGNPGEMKGMNVADLFESNVFDDMLKVILDRGVEYREVKAKRKDGTLFDVAYAGNAVRDKKGEPIYMFGSFVDITSRKQAEVKLAENYKQIKFLFELTDAVSRADKLEDIYQLTIHGLINKVHADRASILQFNENNILEFRASLGLSDHYKELASGHCPWSRDARDPEPILVPDALADDSLAYFLDVIKQEGIRALGFIPLVYSGKLLGKFMVYYDSVHPFSAEEIRLLQTIASEVAFAIGEKESELALINSEQQYRDVVDNTREVIFQTDSQSKWTLLNMAWTEIFGYSREESLGQDCLNYFIPEDRLKAEKLFRSPAQPQHGQSREELRMLTKQGKICWVELNAKSLFDSKGELQSIAGILRDITDAKEAREQLIREKELSDSIINTLPGIFYIYNSQGRFFRWNQNLEKVTGYSAEEIAVMSPLEFFDDPDKDYMNERSKETFISGASNAESFLFTKKREKIPYYFNCIAVIYEGELCSMGMGIDMTEKRKVEKKLEESTMQLRELSAHLQDVREEERTAIAREIHDELGQQLTVLRFDIAWLQSKIQQPDEMIREKMENVQSLLEKATFTVRKLSSELRPSMLDDLGLADTIEWYLQDYRTRFGIQTAFYNTLENDRIPDKSRTALFRIFQESLTNVIRHARATVVKVHLSAVNEQLILQIEDNGVGFDMEKVSRKKTLGLIGMKERCLLMGGKCQIESNPGQGTVVTVSASLNNSFSSVL